jgi:hypothetical protein
MSVTGIMVEGRLQRDNKKRKKRKRTTTGRIVLWRRFIKV